MIPKERCRLAALLIKRVDFDGVAGNVEIHFHPTGIANLGAPTSHSKTNQ